MPVNSFMAVRIKDKDKWFLWRCITARIL